MKAFWRAARGAPLLLTVSCGAVFPEISPPIRALPAGREIAPPPPHDLVYVTFAGAEIPSLMPDGQRWDSSGAHLPDPFAVIFVNDSELVRTPIQSDTLTPTWPDQKHANYRIPENARVRLEVWDSNTINNHPICLAKVFDLQDAAGSAPLEIDCEGGARVKLKVDPAHARWGLGFLYELRTSSADITRVLAESPAARAGLHAGDEIVEVQGKPVSRMEEGELQSLINANAQIGIDMLVRGGKDDERKILVKEGVVYPVADEGISVD